MGTFRRVLCAIDLEPGALPGIGDVAESVLRAADGAAGPGAKLVILHALPVNPGAPMSPGAVEQTLLDRERLSSTIGDAVLDAVGAITGRDPSAIEVRVEDGPADRAILEVAAQIESDLVVIGVGGSGAKPVMRRLLGSAADAVVREAPCSVLVVRPSPGPRS